MKKPLFLTLIGGAALALTSCHTTQPPASQTTQPPATEEDRFAAADTNKDGKLSKKEGVTYLVSIMFVSRDANHDGKLTWEEWNVPGSGRSKERFDAADTNKDGTVSLKEANAYAQKVDLFGKEFREADTNGDGFVTRKEAKAYYASKEGPPR